jgi:catechol 2,3-dioxygenase-like lactoylglutathione lyase family enzyme
VKRLHVHVSVDDLDASVRFYSMLFAAEPTVVKPDYAKWMLADPRVNFAISARGAATTGVDHLGIQVEDEGGWSGYRAGERHLLLRQVREVVDQRSLRNFMGDVPHPR